jgi:predicted metalloendopeptidase
MLRFTPVLLLAAVAAAAPHLASAQAGAPTPVQSRALDPANRDTTCSACEDFYRWANGGWITRTPIPGDQPWWSAFHELQDRNFTDLRRLLDEAAGQARTTKDPDTRRLGLFYASCMDSAAVEAAGIRPLAEELGRIAAIRDRARLPQAIGRLQQRGADAGFLFHSNADAKHSRRTIAEVYQAGLGLPEREYYFKPDSGSATIRRDYVAHVGRMLRLAGGDSATATAEGTSVMELETALARASMTIEQQRDPEAVYHLTSAAELRRQAPALRWDDYLRERRIGSPPELNVAQPEFVRTMDSLLTHAPVEQWRAYLRWRLLDAMAPSLSSAFVNESFRFNGVVLQGVKEQRPRWKRCLTFADNSLGEILGRAYVRRYFMPDAKARALAMVRNVQAELRARLTRLTWMSEATKAKAYRKLEAMVNRIGYPDRWRDYSALEVSAGPFATNLLRANAFNASDDLARIGKPTDRTRWGYSPPTVNASYNPSLNVITFPAGILQPPFYDPRADDAVNYGGMGAVIGHEITHGFDDQGRQFDADGNLSGWWDSTDAKAFNARAERLVTQAGEYVVVDTLKANGKNTLGENIADLGGLLIAYGAYERSLEGKPRPAPIDGLTGEQRFFMGWAQVWRSNVRPQFARLLVAVDVHGPNAFRVNGPLANMPEFARAFGCRPGDPMVRPDSVRVAIW